MKKQYINPTIEIVKVEVQHLMNASLTPDANKGTVSDSFAPENYDGE